MNTLLFLFSNKMLLIRAGIHKMLVRIANREDPNQTASSEAVWFVSAYFVWAFLQTMNSTSSKTCKTFLFLFSSKIFVIMFGIHKMLVRIANWEYPGQAVFSEAV